MTKKWNATLIMSLALALTACAPGSGLETPTEPVEILPAATEPLPRPTTPLGIPETGGTAPAAGATNPAAQSTPKAQMTPEATEALAAEPIFIRTSDLVGYEIVTDMGQAVGVVEEALVDEAGTVHYILADVGAFLAVDTQFSAIPWTMFTVDKEKQQIVFTGTSADLTATVTYDPAVLDQAASVVLQADGAALPAEFDQLIRISQYSEFDLRSLGDEALGPVAEVVVDLSQGEVRYALVEVGPYLGTAETTVAVPWERLTLQRDETAQTDLFVLEATEEILRQAPAVDLNALPPLSTWPDLIDPDWDLQIRQFWQNAG